MVTHVVVFRWQEGTTPEQVAALEAALATLPEQIPSVRTYRFGADLGMVGPPGDFAVVATFDDMAGYLAYNDDPAHNRVRSELLLPIVDTRLSAQFDS